MNTKQLPVLNILFLGGAKRVSVANEFIKAGVRNKLDIKIYSYELTEKVPISILAEIIIGMKWSDKQIIDHLIDIIKNNNISIILPFVDQAIEICSKLKTLIDIFIPSSDLNICNIMYDKKKAAIWFKKHAIPVPKDYDLKNVELPVILKPIKGSASQGLRIFFNMNELQNISNPEDYIIQEYLSDNEEFTVDCYVSRNKKIICVVPRIRLETSGGEVVRSITVRNEYIIDISTQLIKKAKLVGPLTIQFIKNKINGNIYVMEVNLRMGGGVILSINSGANIPEMILFDFLNLPMNQVTNWRENTYMTRYFNEVIFYADNN